jgi:hypothetical protein
MDSTESVKYFKKRFVVCFLIFIFVNNFRLKIY